MLTTGSLLNSIEVYLAKTQMPSSVFGARSVSDPNFVTDLRRGRSPSLRLAERVCRFMADNPPGRTKRRSARAAS